MPRRWCYVIDKANHASPGLREEISASLALPTAMTNDASLAATLPATSFGSLYLHPQRAVPQAEIHLKGLPMIFIPEINCSAENNLDFLLNGSAYLDWFCCPLGATITNDRLKKNSSGKITKRSERNIFGVRLYLNYVVLDDRHQVAVQLSRTV